MRSIAAFAAGAIIATAVTAIAVPRATAPADVQRFKTLDAFAQALATVERTYVDPVDEKQLVYDAVRGMVHNLDPNTSFYPPQRYQHVRQDTEGEFGGTGISLVAGTVDDARPRVPPYPIIDEVVKGSPADLAGIQEEDQLVSINNEATAVVGKEVREAGQWENRLRGPSGTRVIVAVVRVGWKEPRTFTIVRAQVKLPTVKTQIIDKGIGYLSINRFSESTSTDVATALTQLKDPAILILDLRGNPGGLVDQAILVADQFLDGGTIVTIRGRGGSIESLVAHKGGLAIRPPVLVLVDQGTASAAEILAATLHDNGRGKLVGSLTYGKGTVQTFFDLDDGSGLKLTTARYYTPKGNSLESKGIVPDVQVEAFSTRTAAGTGATPGNDATIDPQLAAAVKLARAAIAPK